ncbi:MAG: hypothetical protein LBQ24_07180 [Candidatus Peribacteria bacterium]|jgi:hypothetical protein|nr:hypothetical protein [Candidatus Peribacteria bacterium]
MPENDVNALQNQNDNNIPTNIEPEIHEELPLNNPPTVEESPTNIFDDFIKNPEIQEAKDLQKEDKDLYYYLSLI